MGFYGITRSGVHVFLHIKVGEVSGVSGVSIRASEIDIDITIDRILYFLIFLKQLLSTFSPFVNMFYVFI